MQKCKDCPAHYGDTIFLWLDDKLWQEIGCHESDYLCANCILKRLAKVQMAFFVISGDGDHQISMASMKIHASRYLRTYPKSRGNRLRSDSVQVQDLSSAPK